MKSDSERKAVVERRATPSIDTLWDFILDHEKRLEKQELEGWPATPSDEGFFERFFGRLLLQYKLIVTGSTQEPAEIEHQKFWLSVAREQYVGLLGYRKRESVVSEHRFYVTGQTLRFQLLDLRAAAEAHFQDFEDLSARLNRHTDLCVAVRRLRETARANRNTPFYRALVDIHDCILASVPEEMTRDMAQALRDCVDLVFPDMSEEEMLRVTDAVFHVGLRPWRPPKGRQQRRKTASKSRR